MSQQVDTRRTTVPAIIRSAAFAKGVAEVRAGQRPRFDDEGGDDWNYERGRQWAVAAPPTMPLMIGRKVNPKAIKIFYRSKIQ
jgi:hypothetical protein